MSTQTNQYLMYGVRLPYDWHKQWEKGSGKDFYSTFESFMDDTAFTEKVNHKDGIFLLFDGRDGRMIIIGRVIAKSKDGNMLAEHEPLTVPSLSGLETELLQESVRRNFGVDGEFKFWFATIFR